MPSKSKSKKGKGKGKGKTKGKKTGKGTTYWERKYRKLLKKFPFVINNNNNAAGGGGGGGSSSSSGRGGGYAPAPASYTYAAPYPASYSMGPPPPPPPTPKTKAKPKPKKLLVNYKPPPPAPSPGVPMITSKTRDRAPRPPKPTPMDTMMTFDYPPPPPPGSGGIWLDTSTLANSQNAKYPVLDGRRADKAPRGLGDTTTPKHSGKGPGGRKPRGKIDDVYAMDTTPQPPPDPFGGRVSTALGQGVGFYTRRPSTAVLGGFSFPPPPPFPPRERIRGSRTHRVIHTPRPRMGGRPLEMVATNTQPPPPPPPGAGAVAVPMEVVSQPSPSTIQVIDPRKAGKKRVTKLKAYTHTPKPTPVKQQVFVPPAEVSVPAAPVLTTVPEAPQVDLGQIIKNVLAEQAKQEEARKATEDFLADEERAIAEEMYDRDLEMEDEKDDELAMEYALQQRERDLENQDLEMAALTPLPEDDILDDRGKTLIRLNRDVRERRRRMARQQSEEWQRAAERNKKAARLARLRRLRSIQYRQERRLRDRAIANKPVLLTPVQIEEEVRAADPRYVEQLIPEKTFPEDVDPINPQPVNPGLHVIDDEM